LDAVMDDDLSSEEEDEIWVNVIDLRIMLIDMKDVGHEDDYNVSYWQNKYFYLVQAIWIIIERNSQWWPMMPAFNNFLKLLKKVWLQLGYKMW
jgi:hypothetical protein